MDKGQIGNALKDFTTESVAKLQKHLALRTSMIKELSSYIDGSITDMKRISMSYATAPNDILKTLQYIIKKISINYTMIQMKYYHEILIYRTNLLSLEIKRYLARDLFLEKEYILSDVTKEGSKEKGLRNVAK